MILVAGRSQSGARDDPDLASVPSEPGPEPGIAALPETNRPNAWADMSDDVYFEGDPEHDSARRHLERVLKGGAPRRRWPWIAAIAAGGGAWVLWRALGRRPGAADTRATPPGEEG